MREISLNSQHTNILLFSEVVISHNLRPNYYKEVQCRKLVTSFLNPPPFFSHTQRLLFVLSLSLFLSR